MSSIIKQVASSRYEAFLQQCLLPPEMHLFSRAQYVLCSINPTKVPFSRNSGAHIWWQMTNLLPHDTQIYFLIIFIISSIDQQPQPQSTIHRLMAEEEKSDVRGASAAWLSSLSSSSCSSSSSLSTPSTSSSSSDGREEEEWRQRRLCNMMQLCPHSLHWCWSMMLIIMLHWTDVTCQKRKEKSCEHM